MTERGFFDTNVLVYAHDRSAGEKQSIAAALLDAGMREGRAVFSTQVFQEFFVSAIKKLGLEPAVARRAVELYGTMQVVTIEIQDILAAIDIHRLHQFSFWNSLIIRAAKTANCSVLYTEDFQHGRELDGLRILNPFNKT